MNLNKTLRGIAIGALFLVPIFPLLVANSYFFPFITGKAFYFRLLVEVAFAAYLVLALLDEKYRPKLTPLTIGVSVFALVTLVADLLGWNPLRSLWSNFERMEGWITVIHLWAFFIVAVNLFGYGEDRRRLWHRFLNFELLVALFVAGYGVTQLLGWTVIHQGSTRIDASLGNAAYMAVYMLWNAGLAAYMFLIAKAKKVDGYAYLKWVYPIIAVLFSYEVFETGTRGTILGLIGGILLALALYAIFAKNETRRSRWVSTGAIVFILLVGIVFWLNRGASFVTNNEVLNRLAAISIQDAQTQARAYIWPMALRGFTERPILGWGQENFNYIFNAEYSPKIWNQEQWFDRAHSVYFDWLVASGLVGLLSYLSLYVLFLVIVWKSSLSVAEKCVLTGALAGYAIHNIFVFDNLASYVLFFMALGFVDTLKQYNPMRWLGSKPVSPEAVNYVCAPVVIVALVLIVYFFEVRPISANARLIAALSACANGQPNAALFESALSVNVYVANQEIREQALPCAASVITSQQAPGPAKQTFFTLVTQMIQDQIAATPHKDARIYSLSGSFMNNIGQRDQAAQLLEVAHELSPAKQSIDLELSSDYLNNGEVSKAVDLLAAAYQSETADDQVRSAYVIALVADGQDVQAHKLFGADPSLFSTIYVAQAYMLAKQYPKAVTIYETLVAANPKDVNLTLQLAQAEYSAGMLTKSVETVRGIEKDHPEYTSQIEAMVKQILGK